jgi:concanavalin A-like lectin/glucanase superfamily protein/type IX secretion system substrate protein
MRRHIQFALILLLLCFSSTFLYSQNPVLYFDGLDDYVDLGSDAGNGVRTIEMWFKPELEINANLKDYESLVVRNTVSTNIDEFSISFQHANRPNPGRLRFEITESIGNEFSVYSDNDKWDAGRWYHIAAVVDSVNGMMLFIDGVKQKDTNSYTKITNINAFITTIGCWGNKFNRNFNGSIDDVRFSSAAMYSTDFIPPCPDQIVTSATIGMWNFNENVGNIAIDSSNNSFDGTIKGATWVVDTILCLNNSLFFDGIDDYVDLGIDVGNGVRTIEMWFRPEVEINSSLNEFEALTVRNTISTNVDEFSLSFQPARLPNPGHLRFEITESIGNEFTVYSDSNQWDSGRWYHVAAVVDSIKGMMLFIDGIKQKSTNSYTKATDTNSYITTVGCWGNKFNRVFHGSIDDVRFSSAAMYSTDFIPSCPDQAVTPATIGMWNFNEKIGNVVIDSSNNSFNGIINDAKRILTEVCDDSIRTSIDENYSKIALKVYPNPSSDFIMVEGFSSDNNSYQIVNIFGQIVMKGMFNNRISISTLETGIYILLLEKDSIRISKSIVKY